MKKKEKPFCQEVKYQSAQNKGQMADDLFVEPLDADRSAKLSEVCERHNISSVFASHLAILDNYEIIIIADDSGSMNSYTTDTQHMQSPMDSYTSSLQQTTAPQTRWDELKQSLTILVDIAALFDPNGLDIHFINRGSISGITNANNPSFVEAFKMNAKGRTHIVPVLERVLKTHSELPKLIIIFTDGCPTDDQGNADIQNFKQVLMSRNSSHHHPKSYVSIVACTDDENAIGYLNNWDKTIQLVDVIDDYHSEKAEVLHYQGIRFPFSFGDYVVKALVGSVDRWFDKLDEYPIGGGGFGNQKCRCTLL